MSFSNNSSAFASRRMYESCDSHISIYYEQDQKEEEFIGQHSPDSWSNEGKPVLSPPVEIHEEDTTSIDLPPMTWHGFENAPKLLTVTNTGRTLLINGHWSNGRPYIAGGPLGGNYLFSQIHFHCPSEHEINGKRYPLEMHVVHYKTSYLTQERAVHEKDGTVVLVYLFKFTESHNSPMSEITKLVPLIEKVNTRTEATGVCLDHLIKPFASNYYVYWGSVTTKKKSYLLQWIINCNTLCVTQKEVEELSCIIGYPGLCAGAQSSRMQPEGDAVFHVGQDDCNLPRLGALSATDVCNICRCHEITQITCKCKPKKRKRNSEDAECGSQSVLDCKCLSKTQVCKSHCNIHDSSRVCSSHSKSKSHKDKSSCSESKSRDKVCCHEKGTGENVTETPSLRNCQWVKVKSKSKKFQKLFCELRTNEPVGCEYAVNSDCASESSRQSLCEEKRTKKKSKSKSKSKEKNKSKSKSKSKSKQKCKTSDESDSGKKSKKKKSKSETSDESDSGKKSKKKNKCKNETSDESDSGKKSKKKKSKSETSDESDSGKKSKKKNKCKSETSDESDSGKKSKKKQKDKKKSSSESNEKSKSKKKKSKCENETTDGSETEGSSGAESAKTSSKCSLLEDERAKDFEKCKKKCESEAAPKTDDKTSNIRFDVPEKVCQAEGSSRRKQEVVVVHSMESLTRGLKDPTVSTAEVCDLKLTTSGVFSLNSKITLLDDFLKGTSEKVDDIPETKLSRTHWNEPSPVQPNCTLPENEEDIKVLMEGTVTESLDNITSETTVVCETSKSGPKFGSRSGSRTGSRTGSRSGTRSCSRSGTNVKKVQTQDFETSGTVATSSSKVNPSKSKTPIFDLKRKMSLKKDTECSESTNSRMGAALRDSSQNKLGKTKKANDSGLSQSVQEVISPGTNEAAGMNESESNTPGDKKVSNSKLDAKKSSKRITSKKSKEEEKTKNKSKTAGQENTEEPSNEIKTLFEKKQSVKKEKEKPPTGDSNDVQVNFLLTPTTKSNRSCALTTSDSDFTEEKKISEDPEDKSVVAKNYIVNTVTIPKSEISSEKFKKKSRVCLLMEHLFRTENADGQIYKCTSQEYHVAIMYDLNILQEYKGKFHPQELSLGNCETLQLVPKYPELESSRIHLQDCTVGKESLDQICIRVKFLLKETETKQNLESREPKSESPVKKLKAFLDESTQFNYKDPDLDLETDVIYARVSTNGKSVTKKATAEVVDSGSTSKKSTLYRGKEVIDSQRRKIKLQRNPQLRSKALSEVTQSRVLSAESQRKKKETEEPCDGNEEKKLKPLFVKRRKTVYFMYDKVEKDESTGKKIFVGSFRTKEEVENIKKERKIIEENESLAASDKPNDSSNPKCLLSIPNQDIDVEMVKADETLGLKNFPCENKFLSISKDDTSKKKKNMVTLHKYKPKLSATKKECKNVLIGRALSDLNKYNDNFKDLAEVAGVDKGKNPKISVFEMQESSKLERWRNPSSDRPNSERQDKRKNAAAATNEAAGCPEQVTVLQRPNTAEDSSVVNSTQKYSDPKESQAALILIPVEVESLSKIEVILIEHLSNTKKEKKEDENIP